MNIQSIYFIKRRLRSDLNTVQTAYWGVELSDFQVYNRNYSEYKQDNVGCRYKTY